MMLTVDAFVNNVQLFFLIFMRMSAIFVGTPFIGSQLIPMRVRATVAFLIALVVFPRLQAAGMTFAGGDAWQLGWAVCNEIIIGLIIGFIAILFMMVFQLAGQFFSVQLGFGIINVMDPVSEISVPIIGQLQSLFATLIFIGIGGHVFLIKAVYQSYALVPALSLGSGGGLVELIVAQFGYLFETAFILAAPVMATVFIIEVSMGILTKAAPQMNVMMMGFPIKIVCGLLVLIMVMPQISVLTEEIFYKLSEEMMNLLWVMH